MARHIDILIDASGSMGYMKGSKDENQYLLPDSNTRFSLAKKIVIDVISKQTSFNSIDINTFSNKFRLDKNKKRVIKSKLVKKSKEVFVNQKFYDDYPDIDNVYSGNLSFSKIREKINDLKDPEPCGTPLFWSLSKIINKGPQTNEIIVLSDGDANDNKNFDQDILQLIQKSSKNITIHFIGIAQSNDAIIKSKNLTDETGGVYVNLDAYDYNDFELNFLLSRLNTKITSKAIQDSLEQLDKKSEKTERLVSENDVESNETKSVNLEERVSQNTESLKLISNQLNNIIDLLNTNNKLAENVDVIENSDHNNRIGRKAEFILSDALKKYLVKKVKIKWINEHEEQNLPYDFIVEDNKQKFYYESKGTSSDLMEFQLTKKEWEFYLKNRKRYRLCFVNQVDGSPKFVRFTDLLMDMEAGALTPCSLKNKAYKANRIIFSINESKIKWINI